jgi:ADP-ribose pyrophosphatase YjhB (NUDIX family)
VLSLVKQVLKKSEVVDEIIRKAAPDWPLDKISVVDRNILRIGLAELLFGDRNQVPPKVAINEAIELAKTFGGENSSKFVNGVLGAVYKEIGEPGKEQVSKKKKTDEPLDITKLPVENLGGALVYARKNGNILFALVHDVFGYWTLSKGKIGDHLDIANESVEEGTKREIKEEIGLSISIKEKIGENEYVATHPEHGKTLKKVIYFLAESKYQELKLGTSGGLDNAMWFQLKELPELRIYNDIIPLISKAIEIISKNNS